MLVLTRRKGEAITCSHPDGTEIKITVTALSKNQVRLGFEAPAEVLIDREELFQGVAEVEEEISTLIIE